jgi:hypothetical protein
MPAAKKYCVTQYFFTACVVIMSHSVWLLVTANVVPSSAILVTGIMRGLRSSKTSVLTRATWHNIQENSILHSHHHENLKSYLYSLIKQYNKGIGICRTQFEFVMNYTISSIFSLKFPCEIVFSHVWHLNATQILNVMASKRIISLI